jgi:DNA-binding MarR family transcriptional regulator
MSWTFLSNHGHVIVQLAKEPDLLLSDLATRVGITERHATAIVQELKDAGFIKVTKIGRRNRYEVKAAKKLRHQEENKHSLGDLLAIFY